MTDVAGAEAPSTAAVDDGIAVTNTSTQEDIMQSIKTEENSGDPTSVVAGEQADPSQKVDGQEGDNDSEAETLIQSPEKKRILGQETAQKTADKVEGLRESPADSVSEGKSRKRKRGPDGAQEGQESRNSSRRSSPLSSPVLHGRTPESDLDDSSQTEPQKIKIGRSKRNASSKAGSEDVEERSPTNVRRRRPSDIMSNVSKHRPRNQAAGGDTAQSERRGTRSATYPRHSSEERSPSPRATSRREHRRGVSTQLTTGDFERKKRGRPPLINTRRNRSLERATSPSSDDSSSPAQTRPSLNKFASNDHDIMSPAKATGPRKWRDKNGRTYLSRACNNNDLEAARARFAERPEDLNLADNAGNTPLQIAALEGFIDIVRFLLESKCKVDTQNIDKETPLIDAVENGHLEVVKLLLDHGANPRLGNAKGDEPFELVPPDDENYKSIRKLLADAKDRNVKRRRSNENGDAQKEREGDSSRAASAASPRDSPPITGPRSPPALASRRRTNRSESTRNDLLWQANTQENLTRLASKGDVQGVASILNILQKAETESLIAAAKAGHEEVLQYLLGMGSPDPDPHPVLHLKSGFNTPILAAIGRGNPDVVKLLAEQVGFNPARKVKGKTYYEIAADRRGEKWQIEYDVLKAAHDKVTTGKNRKHISPRKTKDQDKAKTKILGRSSSPLSTGLRNSSSPSIPHKKLPQKLNESMQKEKRREIESSDQKDRQRGITTKRESADASVAVTSDRDETVNVVKKGSKVRRRHSDLSQRPDIESDTVHRRRRLLTGKEHRRRKSLVTGNTSSEDEGTEIEIKGETKTSNLKRLRSSHSPEPNRPKDTESRITTKKRRTAAATESSPENSKAISKKKSPQTDAVDKQQDVEMPDAETKPAIENDKISEQAKPVSSEYDKASNDKEPSQVVEPASVAESDNKSDANTSDQKVDIESSNQTTKEVQQSSVDEEEAKKRKEQEEAEKAAEEARRIEEERILAEKAAAEKRLAEEAEAQRKAEEEALKRKKEEEERQERIRRELEERQRRQEEMLRLQRIEIERRRREALPAILCKSALMLDEADVVVKSPPWLTKFLPLFTVQTQQIDPDCPPAIRDEEWIPSFQVSGLLGTKDLNLRGYTSLEKKPVMPAVRECLWKVARNMLSYDYDSNSMNTSIKQAIERERDQKPKFFAMEELFWVKLSDFQDQVFGHPHLSGLQLKKQRISLRSVQESPPGQHSPLPNGVMQASPKLANGITQPSHIPSLIYGNGQQRV